ncbi:LEAF RUST 10 DISEASE-RESISTANCE LOCUS RECEPTOR-LIKE PROTEIN KINASE-like 1.4 isoform X2 [Argentina anserina]|uniref:LEAF RUST 10 DISEASE-RESISTANCE LOCUS RECEPTOR-LIKE PROTEIN KINASE-like 1.4 isoform X2 n=1 Tax=Argentina anserina TaxID=57926 RepID=UPI0021767CB6|nr:LEAF RUST 10 DISEASE-RESISTANCE LOCUS RECEPTOR-LIKE PROTEIN KINASE-like 1.4 isoform X2 [Potentilla anserina]
MHTYPLFLQLLLVTVVVFLSGVPKSSGVDDERYLNCSQSFQCANIPNIGYPFWGSNRPDYCGFPEFMLNCSGDTPSISIQKQEFRVLSINQSQSSFTIARADYWNNVCPVSLTNTTTIDNSSAGVLQLASDVQQLLLFYECPPLNIPLPTELTSQFNCTINSSSGTGADSINYYVTEDLNTYDVFNISDKFGTCNTTVTMRISESAASNLALNTSKENLAAALDSGFNLIWDASNTLCKQCQGSGGKCGYNTTSTDFTCYCKDGPTPSNCAGKGKKIKIGLAVGGAILFGIFVGFYVYFIIQRKKKKDAAETQSKEIPTPLTSKSTAPPSTNFSRIESIPSYPSFTSKSKSDLGKASTYFGVQVFSYAELEEATENFNPAKELGDGGFGTVYYGKLPDGRIVAVKRLYENNFKRVEQFMNEVEILTRLEHQNLVKLYGCTSRRSRELLLVYEYISNGTVADHLHGKRKESGFLSWPVRLSIAIETADALAFLHRNDVIHRDVKTNNILLDDEFCVKVADFGLSRLFPNDQTHVSTAPQGTPGYVDPEYYQCYQLTDKSDVYSFGVVLIELISSLQAVDTNRHRHDINLANLAINKIQNHLVNELVDPLLGYDKDYSVRIMATAVAELAFRCLQQEKDMRPTMEEVLEGLKAIQNEDLGAQENGDSEAVVLDITADEVGLLRNLPPPLSPDSIVTDKLIFKRWDRTM